MGVGMEMFSRFRCKSLYCIYLQKKINPDPLILPNTSDPPPPIKFQQQNRR